MIDSEEDSVIEAMLIAESLLLILIVVEVTVIVAMRCDTVINGCSDATDDGCYYVVC